MFFCPFSSNNANNCCISLESIELWVYEHPTITKILEVSLFIIGSAALISLPFTAPLLGTAAIIGIALTGALLALAAAVSLFALDILIPPHHDMSTHVYTPKKCEDGELYYDGDVPILSLDSDDPFKAGKAHGYLCGDAINKLSRRFDFVMHTLGGRPRAEELPQTLSQIKKTLPPEYLQELEGMIEGYNQWADEEPFWSFPKKLTLDDALLFHLIPDSTHFQPSSFEQNLPRVEFHQEQLAVACSSIVKLDPKNGPVVARNMDWPSFGLAGTYHLIINRKHSNGLHNTVEVGIPGFIGTLTGMNSQGLSLATNVCSGNTTSINGMPSCLYNRFCLEHHASVEAVKAFSDGQSPLGPYHLTVADATQAKSIHFHQSYPNAHAVRNLSEETPLTTLNCRYHPWPTCDMHKSTERQEALDNFFKENSPIEEALALPLVNNWITTHTAVMTPKTRTFKVAFDNAFSGKATLHEVSTEELFQ